ncbi:MAG: ribonuclease Z, partial [Flavobacterium sp.]
GLNYNDIPEKYNVVPSLLEAHDLIEMDEIERDLGF